MIGCPACSRAAAEPNYALFNRACTGCHARAVSRSPEFFAAKQAGGKAGTPQVDAYLALLERVGLTHDAVRAAWQADATNHPAPQAQPPKEP